MVDAPAAAQEYAGDDAGSGRTVPGAPGRIALDLAEAEHPGLVLKKVLEAACRLLGASWGRIWLFDENGERQEVGAAWPMTTTDPQGVVLPTSLSAEQSVLVPLLRRRKKAISIEDALGQKLFPYLKRVAQESGCASIEARPLRVRGQVLGAVVIGFRHPRSLTAGGRRILDDLTEAVAVGLLALRKLDPVRDTPDFALGPDHPAVQLRHAYHLGMLEDSLGELCRALGAAGAAVWRWNELGSRFEIEGSHVSGDPETIAGAFETVVTGTVSAELFQYRRDLTLDMRSPGQGHLATYLRLKQLGIQVVEALPLVFQGMVLGGICLVFREPPSNSARDRGVLRLVKVQMAATLAVSRSTALLAAEIERRKAGERDLRAANEALKAQAAELSRQRDEVESARHLEQQHVARLRELDQLKTNFLNAASHELRTPLSSIKGYSEFLADELTGALNPEQHGFVHEIQAGADRLTSLVDDMLDFARLEAGTFQVAIQESDIRTVVAGAISSLMPQAKSGGITIARALPDAPIRLPMDPKRIEQVLLNLIGNAIKFTRHGGRIVVRVRRQKDSTVCVSVRDTGVGITADDLARVFDKFFQADPSTTREHGGAGLGLAISKAIVYAHGGSIGARSTVGKGSVFEFWLPAQPLPATAALPVAD